ncbi:ABC transporter permease [Bacillus sp. BP-3]|uniref:ABC transporter permease n=1 Tax=Bacillus sp. BP-3 TaxID=3022773 RepID=UPI00232F762B|nr:ABC transporter permease [Bacillus sp. BP-3]MDC2865734.1 ABC transporter permease [Bacillus sp. BP-3]
MNIFFAEWKKSHRNHFHSKMVYFSLFIWPVLLFATAYFSVKPFDTSNSSPLAKWMDPKQISFFLITGYIGYVFFWSLVQSAWQMSWERQNGTLELIFLTPVSRVWMMYCRAGANLIEGVWMFTVFSILIVLFFDDVKVPPVENIALAFIVLCISAVVWGGILNTIFLFSRDASILFTILEEPMQFFAGVRIPVVVLPLWGKIMAALFPLTYVLQIFRALLMEGESVIDLFPNLCLLFSMLALLVVISYLLVRKAEKHAKRTGNMVLF